jgi:ankyrin repeat protein
MARPLQLIPLLVFSMLWSAGCAAMSPTLPPATATAFPATPTALPVTVTPTATIIPVNTLTNEQKQTMTEQLIRSAEAGDTATIQTLLQGGANINGTDERGRTAVMAATHANQVETVRALIDVGADINIRDNRMDNPFLYASAEGLLEIVKLTIDAGADTKLTNRFGGTALIPAAERGHVEIVYELLTRTDVDVNHINNLGWTALLEAIILSDGGVRHQQIVQLLVDHGADINIADGNGITPLEHARARGFKEIEQILLAAQARDMQMIVAAGEGDIETVRQLLAQGANVKAQDENGRTALIAAAYRNDLAIVDVLIQAGADVNVQDNTQQSAYLISTSEGYLELLRLTLRAGADVHSTDSYNGTGLIRAADRGHVEIIQELLKTDIKIDHVNNLGWTALLEAIILGDGGARHTEVVWLLVEAGADVNLADGNGITPLAHARQRGYVPMIEILQKAGAR